MSDCKYYDKGEKDQLPICEAPIPEAAEWKHVGGTVTEFECARCFMYEQRGSLEEHVNNAIALIKCMSADELEEEFKKHGYSPQRK